MSYQLQLIETYRELEETLSTSNEIHVLKNKISNNDKLN